MSSVMRFDEWQDSNGTTLLDGAGGSLTVPSGFLPAGSVLQVVQNTHSTQFSTNSTSYQDTGLTASITPSSTNSKILVLVSQPFYMSRALSAANNIGLHALVRDTTIIRESRVQIRATGQAGAVEMAVNQTISELDNPSTTSSVTYKTQVQSSGSTPTIFTSFNSKEASITLLEIAG